MAESTTLPTYKMYTIGWIVALDNELTSALAMLDETHKQPEDFEQKNKDSNTYSWGQIGDHKIVIASLGAGSYGLVSAATTATCMATSLPHLRIGLMVGIGAGVPSLENDVRLGDVVVSQPRDGHSGVVQYDLGKMRENGHFQRVGALAPPPDVLLKVLNKLKAEQRLKGSKLPQILSQAIQKYPTLAKPKGKDPAFIYQGLLEIFLGEQNAAKSVTANLAPTASDAEGEIERENRPSEDPEIHYGTIASGNLVIKDGAFRDQMTQQLGSDVLCYEMEAAALMNNFPCLVIRGICDYADTHKNDRWQNYAAIVAAAYTRELLEVIEVNGVEKAERIREVMA
ncbi:nacht and ankyrin domain protein [Colletotrichum chrysophilum]|uniref:Nacht and ankyrin domain protein n=1 Tax=Colletotrichum chrysophilum TaxID=1836956 RepID=A0AAD9EEK9_9PEZI|nr:nacht and ankyrin domain protein [Colletotrichum chrysophilum]